MKLKNLLFFPALLLSFQAFSQNITVGETAKPLLTTKNTGYTGSPYLNDQYTTSKIVTTSGKNLDVPSIRYNLLSQQLEFLSQGEINAVQDSVKTFTMIDSAGKTKEFVKIPAEKVQHFFEVAVPGKVSLLKYYTAKKETAVEFYTKKQTKTIKKEITWFYGKEGKAEKLGTSNKNILTAFGDQQDKIKAYLKENSPELKNEADLVALFTFYNQQK